MKIIPAIDILDNKLVRLEKGEYDSAKVYSDDPFEMARTFSDFGFEWLHIVDLSGAKSGKLFITELISRIKNERKLKIQVGGGIRNLSDAKMLIDKGVDRLVIGSISVIDKQEFEKIISEIGPEKIIASVDLRDDYVMVKGWTLNSEVRLSDHIKYCLSINVKTFLCTDIKKDGMLTGPNLELYKNLLSEFPSADFIASGGISCLQDLIALRELNIYAAVVGKAIYENKIDLKELKKIVG
ncbi:Phosphoribosylformimino-5-aminoimidazole carboxamide ribonucleotide isomerase [Ignavibacterium album JCM 16511]|uniref:1-(5-phosphoribosyl)-5-[(5-phosphoribosylamino)methylideneamino] imidazole-4-carboxamide isomerase n=1 Tax=Ignavibacterium album (strain DSM 19864 / JCM 16511 / NBRC 101810 / Mat9-16) TaxID=945713 RepID=I0AGQ9_IGNAJ|nr:1-(5-phosphoribosyl)-5-[(5-phosphoribosylamino)methylideneamino]imidazole-4-carboxamide isomerase [Ignavibacterium album]AFH48166.1 Phosphoribosylformimino-5-aminoimidazole carboxamide ribonucleotide isomerase [Ignavibacterium album JCM 16511]